MSIAGGGEEERRERVEVVARSAAEGDTNALDELLRLIEPEVARRCQRILPNALDAEEATQDALMVVVRRINAFEGRSTFRTWLYRVSSNASIDTYRRLKRRSVEGEAPVDLTSDNRTSVIAGTRVDLLDALERIDDRFGEPVVLRDLQGLDYAEIADALDVPVGTVKSRIHEGRRLLQQLLA